MHKQLIATELSNLGFATHLTQTGVLVSLNRPISRMEVETALEQVFEEVQFEVSRINKSTVKVAIC